jgi:hypothetical protein
MTLSIEEFGTQLLKTNDLDPVYNALCGTLMPEPMMHRLLVAYWCFYHLGAAAYIAESRSEGDFRLRMAQAAANVVPPKVRPEGERWPRAAERRHFRGEQSMRAVGELIVRYKTATDMMNGLVGAGKDMTYASATRAAESHRGFGQWIGWKIADMAERVLRFHVDFSQADLGIYKDPRQGAALAHYQQELAAGRVAGVYAEFPWKYPINDDELAATVAHYARHFRKFKAPPHGDRPVNVQEIETIFCKYKSHYKGHYPLGKDTREVGHGLEGWGDLAQQLKRELPHHAHH